MPSSAWRCISSVRICTSNVNSVRLRAEQAARFVAEQAPDVLCLQEIKCREGEFPREVFVENPHAPKEVAWYLPDVPPGHGDRVQSNDLTVDDRGFIYLLDRIRGCHILERV